MHCGNAFSLHSRCSCQHLSRNVTVEITVYNKLQLRVRGPAASYCGCSNTHCETEAPSRRKVEEAQFFFLQRKALLFQRVVGWVLDKM